MDMSFMLVQSEILPEINVSEDTIIFTYNIAKNLFFNNKISKKNILNVTSKWSKEDIILSFLKDNIFNVNDIKEFPGCLCFQGIIDYLKEKNEFNSVLSSLEEITPIFTESLIDYKLGISLTIFILVHFIKYNIIS